MLTIGKRLPKINTYQQKERMNDWIVKQPRGFILADCKARQFDKTRQRPRGIGVVKSETRKVKKEEKGLTTKGRLETTKQTQKRVLPP